MQNPQTLGQTTKQIQKRSSPQRQAYVGVFLGLKKELKTLPREILFLALAVCDKYFGAQADDKAVNPKVGAQVHRLVLTCIWIAKKFLGWQQITSRQMLDLYSRLGLPREQLRSTQWEVLEAIDYQLPCDCTYAAMVRDFYHREERVKNDVGLAKQCLAFYNQVIQLSEDFVLDSQLGPEITKCIVDRCCSNARVRWACGILHPKKDQRPLQQHKEITSCPG